MKTENNFGQYMQARPAITTVATVLPTVTLGGVGGAVAYFLRSRLTTTYTAAIVAGSVVLGALIGFASLAIAYAKAGVSADKQDERSVTPPPPPARPTAQAALAAEAEAEAARRQKEQAVIAQSGREETELAPLRLAAAPVQQQQQAASASLVSPKSVLSLFSTPLPLGGRGRSHSESDLRNAETAYSPSRTWVGAAGDLASVVSGAASTAVATLVATPQAVRGVLPSAQGLARTTEAIVSAAIAVHDAFVPQSPATNSSAAGSDAAIRPAPDGLRDMLVSVQNAAQTTVAAADAASSILASAAAPAPKGGTITVAVPVIQQAMEASVSPTGNAKE